MNDLVEAMIKMMDTEKGFTGPVNLGNPVEFTILELAEMIIRLVNSDSKIIFRELPEDDPLQRKPDISIAREKLNWNPLISLEDGLKKTIKYFSNIIQEQSLWL